MEPYRVQLDAYAGPLDLLLHLVKRHEIDLHEIPIAQLTEQYLEHLKVIQAIDVDKAGEFLVMAATLLEIKSRVLMPREREGDEADGDAATDVEPGPTLDPRHELVQQLLAYKQHKDAAAALQQRHEQWARRYAVHVLAGPSDAGMDEDQAPARDLDLEDVHVMDLCEAFGRMLDSIGQTNEHEVTYDETPISLHAEDIHDRLQREGGMELHAIFAGRSSRSEMIGLFLAALELVRDGKVAVRQDGPADQIRLEPRPDEPDATPDDPPA